MNYDSNKIPYSLAIEFLKQFIEDNTKWRFVSTSMIRRGFGELSTTVEVEHAGYNREIGNFEKIEINGKPAKVKGSTKFDFMSKLEKKILKECVKNLKNTDTFKEV